MLKKILSALTLCAASLSFAQGTTTGLNFGLTGGAVGLYRSGQNSLGTISVQSLTVTPNFLIESTQLLVPTLNQTSYFGGLRYNFSPSIFSKTVLPQNTFLLSLHAAPGMTTFTGLNKFSAMAGVELDYAPMSDGKFGFGPRVDAVYFGDTQVGFSYSMNLRYLWGGTTPTAAAQSRAALKKHVASVDPLNVNYIK